MGANKPRNIRDIAHLYLSRSNRSAEGETRAILVASVDRDCFSAFHVVNMAAALAARGHGVRLAEISDEPLNTGFFLSLPPSVYVDPPGDDVSVSALGRVTLTHSFSVGSAVAGARGRAKAGPVHLVHLPPVETATHGRVLRYVTETAGTPAILLYLTAGAGETLARPEGAQVCAVNVRGQPDSNPLEGITSLGRIDRWRSSLGDPIPPVVRDPQSVLARSYQSLCESLVSPILGVEQRSRDEEPRRAARSVRAYRKTRSTPFGAR